MRFTAPWPAINWRADWGDGMSDEVEAIEVTDRFIGWAEGFKHFGLSHAFRVRVGMEEVTGAAGSKAAAWKEARNIKQRLVTLHKGQTIFSYRTFRILARKEDQI